MKTIKSRDGTTIAFFTSGAGAPLVLVHGTTADHSRWEPILHPLEAKFTVYAVDRRGRGESGDTEPYLIEREYEDIALLVDSLPESVNLLGHSYGALCSLEAATRTQNLRRLILYEPPFPIKGQVFNSAPLVAEMQAKLKSGDREGVVTLFMRDVAMFPQNELEMMKTLPTWKGRVAAAHTILRELAAPSKYKFEPQRFNSLRVPTLLLLGGESPTYRKTVANELKAAIPNSRISVMPGQQHAAMNTAPEMFVREVLEFLAE
jgi:pimeloyl-ACP methyl ester carboxylesterase